MDEQTPRRGRCRDRYGWGWARLYAGMRVRWHCEYRQSAKWLAGRGRNAREIGVSIPGEVVRDLRTRGTAAYPACPAPGEAEPLPLALLKA